jgi:hypothetical protein
MTREGNLSSLQTLALRSDIPADARDELSRVIADIRTPLSTDNWIYRLVVVFLGLTILATVIGGIYLAILAKGQQGIELSQGIVAIGSAAVGALAGLLAPSPKS